MVRDANRYFDAAAPCSVQPQYRLSNSTFGVLRVVETDVEASGDGECSGEPRDLCESLELWVRIHNEMQIDTVVGSQAPWKLKKTDPERCAVVLAVSLETLRCIAIAYQAFMPCSAEKLLAQIGVGEDDADARMLSALKSRRIPAGTPLITPVPIFPRIQEPVLA